MAEPEPLVSEKTSRDQMGVIERLGRLAALAAGLTYALGFVIVTLHDGMFGIVDFNALRPTVFGAGLLLVLLTGLPATWRAYPEPLAVPSSSVRTELASARRIRERNKPHYRLAHWPIWIFVFFLAPGPLTFQLFAYGFNKWMMLWLGAVLVGTGIAGLLGRLPGVEPCPYIIRFTEDKPNPWYRRICYTFAWSAAVTYAVLNTAGLVDAIATGRWQLRQIYEMAYFPLAGAIWLLGLFGILPRVRPSTKGEGTERRYFYGTVWAVAVAQPVAGLLWVTLPRGLAGDILKLTAFIGILTFMGLLARKGVLPRTRRIIPGELAVSD